MQQAFKGYLYMRWKALSDDSEGPELDKTEVCESKDSAGSSSAQPWPIGSEDEPMEDELPEQTLRASCRDPVEFCGHLQREIKKTQQRVALQQIEAVMTREQREQERAIQRQQMEAIFRLMEEQKEKFGITSLDDVHQQMNMYIQ